MNKEEFGVLEFLNIGRILSDCLDYCLSQGDDSHYNPEMRTNLGNRLKQLTREKGNFDINCDNNGDNGKLFKEEMGYFIEDVFADDGRIVSLTLDKKVHVEQSLVIELLTSIIKLRVYAESFITAGVKLLKEKNLLDNDFENLIKADMLNYHAKASKISSILLSNKFFEYRKNVQQVIQDYAKSHGGADPRKDPEFKLDDDPSIRMLRNEFEEISKDLNTAMHFGDDIEEFKLARQKVYDDFPFFSGKKRPTDVRVFINMFCSYFDRLIATSQMDLQKYSGIVNKETQQFVEELKKSVSDNNTQKEKKEN